jgi:hypothetical protein
MADEFSKHKVWLLLGDYIRENFPSAQEPFFEQVEEKWVSITCLENVFEAEDDESTQNAFILAATSALEFAKEMCLNWEHFSSDQAFRDYILEKEGEKVDEIANSIVKVISPDTLCMSKTKANNNVITVQKCKYIRS